MKEIDTRLTAENLAWLRNMCGQSMVGVKCDPFYFSAAVYGVVGICMDGYAIQFTNSIEVQDHFGAPDDVAVFKVEKTVQERIHSQLDNTTMIDLPIHQRIKQIRVINEHQSVFQNDVQTYSVDLTRGIIFKFEDGLELSIEKDVWFSEFMDVRKGYDLLNQFAPTNDFVEEWTAPYHGTCSRSTLMIE